ncbi:MAG: DUF4383 domain-containing protein [Patescibacteria group bacterium]
MAKKIAVLFGVIFVLVGILGFIPNPLVGPTGLFDTDTVHNLIHLIFGVILLIVAMSSPMKSALWLKILGIVYLLLAIIGFLTVPDGGSLLGIAMTNMADHWLHIVLGIVLLVAGVVSNKPSAPAPVPPTSM